MAQPNTAQALSIDGLVNVRDLGGLVTKDGRVIRARQVVRGDNPKSLTEQGHRDLADAVAPTLVVDLRIPLEVDREGYELSDDIRVLNLAMMPQSGVNDDQYAAGLADNLVEDYRRQIGANADVIVTVLRLIADPTNRPVMVHCTAGKDRTGIVVAMLLSILGVEPEVIVADYHVTTKNMAPIVERIRNAPVFQDNGLAGAPAWIFESEPETMREFLAQMTATYGGAEQWALANGLSAADIDSLRTTLLYTP